MTAPTTVLTGDKEKTQIESFLVDMPLDNIDSTANLDKESQDINHAEKSGKQAGGMVAIDHADIAIALGSQATDKWVSVNTGTATTPAVAVAARTNIGDTRRRHKRVPIAANHIPVVKEAELKLQASKINLHSLSGKKEGSMVISEKGILYIAQGSTPTAKWKAITKGGADLTPAGAVAPDFVSATIGQRGVSHAGVTVAHNSGLIIAEADLQDKAHPVNIKEASGKREGGFVLFKTAGNTIQLAVAADYLPESPWKVLGTSAIVTPA